ncbi:hypothetical protein [Pectobacterium polaris]|nr:hypothetical protein [Pectobacterium polaris]MCA6956378.1 hypothetical protein [Pectobacterium polaris]
MLNDERNLTPVAVAPNEIEISSDLVSMTSYYGMDGLRVNFAFFGPQMRHFVHEESGDIKAMVELVKLGSVSMSHSAAVEFHEALTKLIEGEEMKK